jgi:hypothetical protein
MLCELCERVTRGRALSATKERHVDKFARNPSKKITSIVGKDLNNPRSASIDCRIKGRRRIER